MSEQLIADLFQSLYFFSVLLMFLAALDKVEAVGIKGLTIKQKGELWGSMIAVTTFSLTQILGALDVINLADYSTAPMSFFVLSVCYNIHEYAGVNVFESFKHKH